MAQYIRHRFEGRTATDHVRGDGMTEHVRTRPRGRHPSIPKRLCRHYPDGLRAVEGPIGRTQVQKHSPLAARGTAVLQVGGQCGSSILGQRKDALPVVLACAYQQLPLPPVNVLQAQAEDFTGTQAQARQQEQDGPVAKPLGGSLMGKREHLAQFARRKSDWQCRVLPLTDGWDCIDKMAGKQAFARHVAQKRP